MSNWIKEFGFVKPEPEKRALNLETLPADVVMLMRSLIEFAQIRKWIPVDGEVESFLAYRSFDNESDPECSFYGDKRPFSTNLN